MCVDWNRVLLLIALLSTAVGCSGTAAEHVPAPISTAPTEAEIEMAAQGPVTSTDNSRLMKGAGPVDADVPAEFTSTASGLKYRILRKSTGAKPSARDEVQVHYRGWLDNGKVFDSSYDRGEPISFPLNGVIPGWTEGMQLIGEGGMIELWIPSKLGYGARGAGGDIPPNAPLHFIVELLDVM
jgi:FKBP-type peptidyl-prolyl cis-trans isomerase FkpA